MGAALSLRPWSRGESMKVLMVGLDAAGKTTILYKACTGKVTTTIPTIGFNVEEGEVSGAGYVQSFTSWDVGGRCPLRPLWRHFYRGTDVLVYVVDSSDVERLEDVRDNLQSLLLEKELAMTPLLVFAHKQDLPSALPPAEIAERLALHSLRGRHWYIEGTCFNSADGIFSGLNWAARTVNSLRRGELSNEGGRLDLKSLSLSRLAVEANNTKHSAGAGDSDAETESTAATETAVGA